MPHPNANMRSVGIPITAAAWRSCAVACRPRPVSVRVTNHQSAAKDNRQMPPVISCGWPMKIGPICTRPAVSGLATVRKSGVQRNCAQRDTEAERAADLGEHGRLQQLPDDAEVRQYAGKGEDNDHERQRCLTGRMMAAVLEVAAVLQSYG